ncbi:MAG: RNase adapter RapZ [Thermoleophilia bacterium]
MSGANPLGLTVITGLSGAGKSQAVATFEDMGFFCIDNLPPQMLSRVVDLFSLEGSRVDRLAVVIDVRGAQYFSELGEVLDSVSALCAGVRILFLEASDESLVARYQSTRRPHPLAHDGPLLAGIQEERRLLAPLRERADVVIDTTGLNVHELRHRVQETLFAGELRNQLLVTFVSFGFKFGVPTEADMVFDARFLPNPHWVDELRPLTGLDREVSEFVVARPESHGFLERVAGLILFLVPLYLAEQKTQLVIAIGCTGGRHRSVALAEALAVSLSKDPQVETSVRHRDVARSG